MTLRAWTASKVSTCYLLVTPLPPVKVVRSTDASRRLLCRPAPLTAFKAESRAAKSSSLLIVARRRARPNSNQACLLNGLIAVFEQVECMDGVAPRVAQPFLVGILVGKPPWPFSVRPINFQSPTVMTARPFELGIVPVHDHVSVLLRTLWAGQSQYISCG